MAINPSASIHPSAVIEQGAIIGAGCRIGAFSLVGKQVKLGKNIILHSHVVIAGCSEIGQGCVIFPFASIGHQPQDLKFKGEHSTLKIGKRNIIRENVTINPGTQGGGSITKIGDDCLFMVGSHVAHDCRIGNQVIFANQATVGGHCVIDDHVIIGGLSVVHQYSRIGHGAMIGGFTAVANDVIPYGMVIGKRGKLCGLNLVGLKRRGCKHPDIALLRTAYKELFFHQSTLKQRAKDMRNKENSAMINEILDFVLADTNRSINTPKRK